jgi:hypothetical protein
MSEKSVIFADHLLNVAVGGPLVRLQWGVMDFPQLKAKSPGYRRAKRWFCPWTGCSLRWVCSKVLVKQLVKDGVLKAQMPEAGPNLPFQ